MRLKLRLKVDMPKLIVIDDTFDELWHSGTIGAVHYLEKDVGDVFNHTKAVVREYRKRKQSGKPEATNVYYKHSKGSTSGRLFSTMTSLLAV